MATHDPGHPSILEQARRGGPPALGRLLEEHRDWLQRMAEQEISGRLGARLSASDVVQQTCLSAIRKFAEFAGTTDAEFHAWLKGVHQHNIQDAIRQHARAKKRAVGRQEGSPATGTPATASAASPSRQLLRDEAGDQLRIAIATLPTDQATAVRLRHFDHLSLNAIAQEMGRTDLAVASLLKRGLETLRRRLEPPTDG